MIEDPSIRSHGRYARAHAAHPMNLQGDITMATNNHIIVPIKVKLVLNAKNGLRRVIFGLEKNTDGDAVK